MVCSAQRLWCVVFKAKKVVSNNLWPVNFAIKVVNSVLNLPDGQVKFFGDFKLQTTCNQSCSLFFFFGLIHASDKCSNEVMKHDNLVQHYMILLYDIIINSLCMLQSNDNVFFMVSYMYFYSGTV